MGAKRTPDLVPLCHPIALTGVKVDLALEDEAVRITATVKTTDRTGVEMEALTAVAVAGLTCTTWSRPSTRRPCWTRCGWSARTAARPAAGRDRRIDEQAGTGCRGLQPGRGRVYADRTGPVITAWLRERGYEVSEPVVVPDGDPVAGALRAAVAEGVAVVLTTGGTGVTPTDRTPEATRSVLDYEIPGIADAIRAAGLPKVPTAVLSRGVSGVAGTMLVVNLPGSTGGVKDGLAVLDGVLDHAVDQLAGGDHPRPAESHAHRAAAAPTDASAVVVRAEISETPVSAAEHVALVSDRTAGAVVTFEGVVRDHDHGRGVTELEYSSHPSAKDVIADVAAEIAARHPEVRAWPSATASATSPSATWRWPAPCRPPTGARRSWSAPNSSTR